MIAILSDIHGNLAALEAVLEDIERQGVQTIYCLGDVVGYGPDPCACLDRAQRFGMTLLGNHDQGALFDPEHFSGPAERAIFWTREQMETSPDSREAHERRWEFLSERPRTHRENGCLFVHGSARNPLNEYVFPEDVFDAQKMGRIFEAVERYCFQGHTHVPGIFSETAREGWVEFFRPADLGNKYRLNGRKILCNVGSVGQPRDGDPRASYVLLDDDGVQFRRVEYDVEATVAKIHAIDALDRFLGDRLREGR